MNEGPHSFFDLLQKKHIPCKYASDIYMAKYSELTLNQNVVYIFICMGAVIYLLVLCIVFKIKWIGVSERNEVTLYV